MAKAQQCCSNNTEFFYLDSAQQIDTVYSEQPSKLGLLGKSPNEESPSEESPKLKKYVLEWSWKDPRRHKEWLA